MIINHPVLNRFSPSLKEVAPQTGDDSLLIRPEVQLTGLPPEPLNRTIAGAGAIQETSFFTNQVLQITNSGGLLSQICTLRNGYWNLRFSLSYIASFLGTLQSGECNIAIDDGSAGIPVLTVYGTVGAQTLRFDMDVMVRNTLIITLFLSANGVGQDHRAMAFVYGGKLL
jgi:hypothetical protein